MARGPQQTRDDAPVRALRSRLRERPLRDEHRLVRRLDKLRRTTDDGARAKALAGLVGGLERAEGRVARRRATVPERIAYPPELPVSARRDDLLAAIRDNQVVVVAGETGSGKTT